MTSMSNPILLPFQPDAMTPAQLTAVVLPGPLHRAHPRPVCLSAAPLVHLVRDQRLDPLLGIQRAHLELYIRHLGESGLRVSSVNRTGMAATR